jgi:hypothetical protein
VYEANDGKEYMRFHNAVRNSRAEMRSEEHELLLRKCCKDNEAKSGADTYAGFCPRA